MSNLRNHARNLLANWIGQASGLIVVFFMSPFVVHTLGTTSYGLWSLLNVFTGYLGVFDLGMRASTGRFVIFYVGRNDQHRVNDTLRTGLSFFSLISLLILAVAAGVSWAFPVFFPSVPAEYHHTIRILLPLLAVNVWLSAMSGAFASILAAYDRFDLSAAVDVTITLVRTGAVIVALLSGWGILGMTVATVASSALATVANGWMAGRVCPGLKVWPPKLIRERLREMFSFGTASFVGNIASMLTGQTDMVVVGTLLGVSAVTTYSIGAMLVFYTGPFIGQICSTVFPSLQRAVAAEDADGTRWTYIRTLKAVYIIGLPLYLGFVFFGGTFIRLWMGDGFAGAFAVMAILSVSRLVNLASGASASLLYAKGHVWWLTTISSIVAVTNVGASVAFVLGLHWGLAGMAAGNLAAFCAAAPFYLRHAQRTTGLRVGALARQVFLPALCAAGAFSGWCLLVRTIITARSWAWFAVQAALALLGYVLIAMWLLVSRSDRARMWKSLGLAPAAGERLAPAETDLGPERGDRHV